MLSTNFQLLKEHEACETGYKKLLKSLGGIREYGKETPITLIQILESNGLFDALWALRAVFPEQEQLRNKIARLAACEFAERVLPIFEKQYPDDKRPRQAIETARRFAFGLATQEELDVAKTANSAGLAAASWAASWAARAAGDASWAALDAAGAAGAAAWGARAAAGAAEKEAQTQIFRRLLKEEAIRGNGKANRVSQVPA